MRILIALAALCVAAPAFAHSLFWNRVATYDDGTAIDVSDTVNYRIEWSDNGFVDVASRMATAASVTMPDPPAGTIRCYRVFALVAGELDSFASNEWCRSSTGPVVDEPPPIPDRRPNAPTGLSGN